MKGVVKDLPENVKAEEQVVIDDHIYFPNRLEYFAGLAMQGLLSMTSEKNRDKCVPEAIAVAIAMENALDKFQ